MIVVPPRSEQLLCTKQLLVSATVWEKGGGGGGGGAGSNSNGTLITDPMRHILLRNGSYKIHDFLTHERLWEIFSGGRGPPAPRGGSNSKKRIRIKVVAELEEPASVLHMEKVIVRSLDSLDDRELSATGSYGFVYKL